MLTWKPLTTAEMERRTQVVEHFWYVVTAPNEVQAILHDETLTVMDVASSERGMNYFVDRFIFSKDVRYGTASWDHCVDEHIGATAKLDLDVAIAMGATAVTTEALLGLYDCEDEPAYVRAMDTWALPFQEARLVRAFSIEISRAFLMAFHADRKAAIEYLAGVIPAHVKQNDERRRTVSGLLDAILVEGK